MSLLMKESEERSSNIDEQKELDKGIENVEDNS